MFDTNYYTKIATVGLIVFLILLFLKTLTFTNALLLTLIIATSIMIVDNLQVFGKVDCSSCKVEKFQNVAEEGSLVPNPDNPIFTQSNTNFETDIPYVPTTPTVSTLLTLTPNDKSPVLKQTNTNAKAGKLDYMSDYVDYQINGEEAADMDQSLKNYQYKLSSGDQSLTVPYLKDSQKFYEDIKRRGVNNIEADDLVKANLEYGSEYNYLGPLNFGMSNRAYSFVMPNNWNTVQAMPPVCAIDKKHKSVVYPVLHASNHAAWANLEEFDRAARFTGNQQINIDYIKNVLNNPYV